MKRFASFFAIIIVALFSTLIISNCAKEYSYEGGAAPPQSSVYTFVSLANSCLGATVSGIYKVDKMLDAANTVQLTVRVTQAGSYSQTTTTAGGFNFSGSGVFTDTGVQTITLQAAGKPTAAGSFTFNTSGSVCGFQVNVLSNSAIFTLSGAPGNCEAAMVNGNYVFGDALKATNYVDVKVDVTDPGPYSIQTDTINGFSFSASGTFTSAGIKTVSLAAKGNPNQPGIYTFTPKGATSACTFDVPVINAAPLAVYVLESGFGSPAPCIYTVNGTYTANNALNGGNTVKMTVFVQTAGNFTVETNRVNGVKFSYTGTFTTTGNQTILLTGSGTPAASGTFTFIPQIIGPHPLGGETCAFDVKFN